MSKDAILAALRSNRPKNDDPLDLADISVRYDNPVVHFKTMLGKAGALVLEVETAAAAQADLATRAGEDAVLVQGLVGVAENAAIWVPFVTEAERPEPFLADTLAVVVQRDTLVSNMQQAYRRIAEADLPDYGVFMAGPSKTADIAQCLVIGAHGPIEFIVYLVSH